MRIMKKNVVSLSQFKKAIAEQKATKFEQDLPYLVGDVEFIIAKDGAIHLGYSYKGKNMFWGDGLKINALQLRSLVNRGFYKEVRKGEYFERVNNWRDALKDEQQNIQYRSFLKVANGGVV